MPFSSKQPTVSQFFTQFSRAHLLSIKFADEGTAVTIALACEQTVAWSRHATKERVQWGNDTTGSVTSMQFLFANSYSHKSGNRL